MAVLRQVLLPQERGPRVLPGGPADTSADRVRSPGTGPGEALQVRIGAPAPHGRAGLRGGARRVGAVHGRGLRRLPVLGARPPRTPAVGPPAGGAPGRVPPHPRGPAVRTGRHHLPAPGQVPRVHGPVGRGPVPVRPGHGRRPGVASSQATGRDGGGDPRLLRRPGAVGHGRGEPGGGPPGGVRRAHGQPLRAGSGAGPLPPGERAVLRLRLTLERRRRGHRRPDGGLRQGGFHHGHTGGEFSGGRERSGATRLRLPHGGAPLGLGQRAVRRGPGGADHRRP